MPLACVDTPDSFRGHGSAGARGGETAAMQARLGEAIPGKTRRVVPACGSWDGLGGSEARAYAAFRRRLAPAR
jgi:hypothetical protein